jgi:hypothetical protein
MLLNYETEIKHIIKDFDKKIIKKLRIDSLINLNLKFIDLEDTNIEKMMLDLKSILKKIEDKDPKQYRIYRKEFENLKKVVIEEYGFHQKGSIVGKYVGIGLAIGATIGTAFASFASSPGVGLAIGTAIGIGIGSGIGTNKEKAVENAGKLY